MVDNSPGAKESIVCVTRSSDPSGPHQSAAVILWKLAYIDGEVNVNSPEITVLTGRPSWMTEVGMTRE